MEVPKPKKISLDEIRNLFDLTGRVAVVTGGSGALGQAAALGLAAYGADVVLVARRAEVLEEAAVEIREAGRRVLTVSCDVQDPASVQAMVDRTLQEFGASTSWSPAPASPTASPRKTSRPRSSRGSWAST